MGADEIDFDAFSSSFIVYQGHHGDAGAHHADLVLPGAAYTEKDGIYVNTEGRVQYASRAAFPPGDAREDWAIIRAVSGAVGKSIGFDSLFELRDALIVLLTRILLMLTRLPRQNGLHLAVVPSYPPSLLATHFAIFI